MNKISYEEYVKRVDKRLEKYTILSMYTHKYNFMKRNKSYSHLHVLFKRYMDNDIFIKWDMER